jgi:hypothetical protein
MIRINKPSNAPEPLASTASSLKAQAINHFTTTLVDPSKRATSHDSDILIEEPLLVNPSKDNPEDFIGYRGDGIFPHDNNEKGRVTIEILGLRDERLRSRRNKTLVTLKLAYLVSLRIPDDPLKDEFTRLLHDAVQPDTEYSAAAKAAIKDAFKFI